MVVCIINAPPLRIEGFAMCTKDGITREGGIICMYGGRACDRGGKIGVGDLECGTDMVKKKSRKGIMRSFAELVLTT